MREMKDSGIEWIGKIPHCWNTSKLKYLGQYINGYAFKPEEWGSKGVPIIRIQDLTGSMIIQIILKGKLTRNMGLRMEIFLSHGQLHWMLSSGTKETDG